MTDKRPTSDDYDAIGHSYSSGEQVLFEVGTNYGHGQPHYYVCLDAGQLSCWLQPQEAMKLGRRLLDLGERMSEQNELEDRRQGRLTQSSEHD